MGFDNKSLFEMMNPKKDRDTLALSWRQKM